MTNLRKGEEKKFHHRGTEGSEIKLREDNRELKKVKNRKAREHRGNYEGNGLISLCLFS
jgi:hypothetical protein